MNQTVLGIIGGGQLGSMLSEAAKKIDIKTVVLSDDPDAPAKNFANKFIYGNYDDSKIITEFVDSVDLVTYEFENIPFDILNEINKSKSVLPKPEINSLIQNRLTEKDFLNNNLLFDGYDLSLTIKPATSKEAALLIIEPMFLGSVTSSKAIRLIFFLL